MRRRTNRRPVTPEGAVLASVLELLTIYRIWHERRNTRVLDVVGAGGKTRPMTFGTPGTGDIFCTPFYASSIHPLCLWIEVKSEGGRQSTTQKEFQAGVEAAGHHYLLARSIDDVQKWFKDWEVQRQ